MVNHIHKSNIYISDNDSYNKIINNALNSIHMEIDDLKQYDFYNINA